MTIFYADDDDDEIFLLKDALETIHQSFTFLTAANGEEALELLKFCEIPNIIFLDINMPLKSGFDVLKMIKEDRRLQHIPVILYSNMPADSMAIEAVKLGANRYLSKETSYEDLRIQLRAILENV